MIRNYTVHTVNRHATYTLLELAPINGNSLPHEAGQYVAIRALHGAASTPVRAFSIVSEPSAANLQLAFRRSGALTERLSSLYIGDEIEVQGPFGSFVLPDDTDPIVMIAGGIGITPFISMLRHMVTTGDTARAVILIHSNRSLSTTPFYDELLDLQKKLPNLQTIIYTENGEDTSHQGTVNQSVVSLINTYAPTADYYICGPDSLTNLSVALLNDQGIGDERIFTESFAQSSKSDTSRTLIKRTVIGSALALASLVGVIGFRDVSGKLASASQTQTSTSTAAPASTTPSKDTATSTTDNNSSSSSSDSYTPTQTYTAPTQTTYQSPRGGAS